MLSRIAFRTGLHRPSVYTTPLRSRSYLCCQRNKKPFGAENGKICVSLTLNVDRQILTFNALVRCPRIFATPPPTFSPPGGENPRNFAPL